MRNVAPRSRRCLAVLPTLPALVTLCLVAGCTGASTPNVSTTPTPSASPTTSVTGEVPAPSPTPTPTAAAGPKVPKVRWDLVPKGSLPRSCSTHGSTLVHVTRQRTAYATGPSLTCVPQDPYLVRAVIKVAVYRGRGKWDYLTPVRPTVPAHDVVAAQTSETSACKKGDRVRAVASFVVTWPSGRQVRYKKVGRSALCP